MVNTREIAQEYRLSHWAGIMDERAQSGLNIKVYCRQIGISTNTYHYWQKRLRETTCEALSIVQEKPVAFTKVALVSPPPELPAFSPVSGGAEKLHIEVSGVQITVDSSYPTDKLVSLLRELVRC